MPSPDDCVISSDRARMDLQVIHGFLSQTYWARNIPFDVVERSVNHSLCFGAFKEGQQVGFARVITDYATFAYIADVFVLPEHRGQGISKRLIAAIRDHPELQNLRRLLLVTKDAHGLYAQFGFDPVSNPHDYMTMHHPNIYERKEK